MEESDEEDSDEYDSDDENGYNKKRISWETAQSKQLKQGTLEATSQVIANALHVPGKRGRKKKSDILEAKKQANQLYVQHSISHHFLTLCRREAAKLALPPPPSICMYTFFNSPDLNSIALSTPLNGLSNE